MLNKIFRKNCCDGIYNSIDVHFTSACDNKCAHCIDMRYNGVGVKKPNIDAIVDTITRDAHLYDDVLFLGGEPCLYLEELYQCIMLLKQKTSLKLFVTTAVPKVCFDKKDLFYQLIDALDGINLSVQSHNEETADKIRNVKSKYDRQKFYNELPDKEKIRINLNIVKPFLYTKKDISDCITHYDKMGFNSIKLSEIQHGKDCYVSFEETFGIKLGSAYFSGCQNYIDLNKIISGIKTPLLLKRSCFLCEDTLKASFMDGVKAVYKIASPPKNNYAVIYGNGVKSNGWR
jgi:organic radical activating enzyme